MLADPGEVTRAGLAQVLLLLLPPWGPAAAARWRPALSSAWALVCDARAHRSLRAAWVCIASAPETVYSSALYLLDFEQPKSPKILTSQSNSWGHFKTINLKPEKGRKDSKQAPRAACSLLPGD